jgi:hypothetical protein
MKHFGPSRLTTAMFGATSQVMYSPLNSAGEIGLATPTFDHNIDLSSVEMASINKWVTRLASSQDQEDENWNTSTIIRINYTSVPD